MINENTNRMKTSKNQIAKKTVVLTPANSLTGMYGQYSANIEETYFKTDASGKLYISKPGMNSSEWIDTGITCENKSQFVDAVKEEIDDETILSDLYYE